MEREGRQQAGRHVLNPPRFETLIDEHHSAIHRYLWRGLWSGGNSHPAHDAEDLTQEVFLRAYRAYESLRPDSNPRAWLYRIATNCLRTHWKQNSRAPLPLDPARPPEEDRGRGPLDRLVSEERSEALQRALGALPLKQRQAVILRYLDELEYGDIAGVLDCSHESARANVSYGLGRLREVMSATPEHNLEDR